MIFVTVGTEKYPFDRLVKEVDFLREKGIIEENVFIQIGTSRYKPKFCEYSDFLPYHRMAEKMKNARIVISHGGPGSVMPVVRYGKVPIVLSRQKKYGEAVDDHQVSFTKKLEEKMQIIASHDADELEEKIKNYDTIVQRMKSAEKTQEGLNDRVSQFAQALDEICEQLIQKEK
jgi:UDP-N-acetylglucosamine transferase subunit ALG13